jgi:hypothetical protein
MIAAPNSSTVNNGAFDVFSHEKNVVLRFIVPLVQELFITSELRALIDQPEGDVFRKVTVDGAA